MLPRMNATVGGGCACGAVRFEARLPPRFVAHCHCASCRRAHGAAFVTYAGFPTDAFAWTAGAERLVDWHTDTGATRSFCGTCGSTLVYRSPRWAGEVHLAVAHVDGDLGRAPGAHVYADRAPAWCPITDELPRYGGPSGTEPL